MGQRLAVLSACAVALAASAWPVAAQAVRSSAAEAALEAFTHQIPAAERVLNHSARRRADPDQFAAQAAHELGHDDRVSAENSAIAAAQEAEHSNTTYREAVRRAVELLPRRPAQVLVIDVNEAKSEDRDYLLKLQAFILKGDRTIYLTMHGEALRGATTGSQFHEHLLATVIWHEMAHLDGADEAEARRREEVLWARFLADGAVDRDAGLNYLVALKHRAPPDDREQSTEGSESDRVVARVQKLLPRQPERIVVVDASRQPRVLQQHIDDAEGFVTTGEKTVYLKKQGSTFQHALQGPGIWDYVLAIIVWHEMAHIAGATEPEAQRQEEELWQQFVLERRVDPTRGLTYLSLLQDRRKPKS